MSRWERPTISWLRCFSQLPKLLVDGVPLQYSYGSQRLLLAVAFPFDSFPVHCVCFSSSFCALPVWCSGHCLPCSHHRSRFPCCTARPNSLANSHQFSNLVPHLKPGSNEPAAYLLGGPPDSCPVQLAAGFRETPRASRFVCVVRSLKPAFRAVCCAASILFPYSLALRLQPLPPHFDLFLH